MLEPTMADEEMEANFDPTLKKKKKKKKPFDPNALEAAEPVVENAPAPAEEENGMEKESPVNEDDLDDLDFLKKKKKKKKTTFNMEELDDALQEEGEEDDLDFNNMKKKKKKKKVSLDDLEVDENEMAEDASDPAAGGGAAGDSWKGTDRDYTYDELLQRAFNIMREKNPDMVAGEKKKFVMKPPQVLRVGTKKTSFANFLEISKTLRRTPKHLQAFLLAELGTSGSVDANNHLIIKGRFQQKQIENILRRYIKEYVTCHTCRAPETILERDTRLHFLRCEKCGSRCSVQSIKSGFQAVTSKRAAIRAKAT